MISSYQKGQGCPQREPVVSEEEQKQMMAYYYRKQEEMKVKNVIYFICLFLEMLGVKKCCGEKYFPMKVNILPMLKI